MNCSGFTPEMLAELRKDYASLISGNKPRVIVDQNGERVEFMAANAARLYQYIQEVAACFPDPCGGPQGRPFKPMGFLF